MSKVEVHHVNLRRLRRHCGLDGSGDRDNPRLSSVATPYNLYIFSYCAFSLALAWTGVDLVTAFGSVAACLNNMGVGLGETAGGFSVLNDTATWLMSLAMLVGRLEIFPLLLLFLPDFWK